jgi:hypothetical protein
MEPHEIDRLVDDGLARYRRGDIDGALTVWEEVLAVYPRDARVGRYVDYVRAHYDQLTGGAPAPLAELLIPFGLAGGDPSGDYEVEISLTPPPGERLAEPAVDDGWWLAAEEATALPDPPALVAPTIELDADEPPPHGPVAATFGDDDATTDYASLTLGRSDGRRPLPLPLVPLRPPTFDPADDSGEATFGGYGRAPGPLELDLELGPSLMPVAPRGLIGHDFHDREPSTELTIERSATARPPLAAARTAPGVAVAAADLRSEAKTAPGRQATSPGVAPLPGIGELALDFEPTAPTADLGGVNRAATVELPRVKSGGGRGDVAARFDDSGIAVEELKLPPPPSRSQPVDDDDQPARPRRISATVSGGAAQLLAEADRDRRPGETVDDTARRRITWLIDRARSAAAGADHAVATQAIDLALAESPDSAVAQKLIHKHRDVLLDCYYKFFGSLERRPIVTGDMTAAGALEPRAAFLCSRIDGMLTFDELLDVAGMGRLEACRHLALLIRRGLVGSQG